jgi:hypothetical protein
MTQKTFPHALMHNTAQSDNTPRKENKHTIDFGVEHWYCKTRSQTFIKLVLCGKGDEISGIPLV